MDLLAIDSAGVVYIIELKLGKAGPSITNQILRYRRAIKGLSREELIRFVADGDLKIDLVKAFQRHFGHPLPEKVNESQVSVIIAASIHPEAADGILELLDEGRPVRTFRYVVRSGGVGLIACCRDDDDVAEGTHLATRPSNPPNRIVGSQSGSTMRRRVDENTRGFWSTNAPDFKSFVTFRFIHERYKDWVYAQTDEGIRLRHEGLFAQDLVSIVAESNEWTRVFVPPCSDMADYDTLVAPPSVRASRSPGHTCAAYLRNS
ncbi:hypothetical protein ABC337_12755 [Arthrobacter sp. 1P04PC]|uniref:hypothetical protein n=1 Tax=unclassified Arthrobacter TaxID=235627 RepID=UPI0039A3F42A